MCYLFCNCGNKIFYNRYTKLLNVPVVTFSTQGNPKLLQELKSCFKRTINWNKYQSKVTTERQNQYSDYLIDPSFLGAHTLVLSFEGNAIRRAQTEDIFFQKWK